eukprot:TRINITY_DN606_c0_g4_i1.p1 TRINITY_DN606_c0_g4~~TRINITY_DN606_c0_g4_i1.p1  ORF type:complete len:414 (-),score=45.09 TRINITY_DN606_c0_g4_i1:341-1582(-)
MAAWQLASLSLFATITAVAGHGWITNPSPRQKGQTDCPHCLSGGSACGNSGFTNSPTAPSVTWREGSIVEITVTVTAHHKGHYEVSICDETITASTSNAQGCLDKHILERASAEEVGITDCRGDDRRGACQPVDSRHPERFYLPPGSLGLTQTYYLKLPAGLTCQACTLQWRWWTANSCIAAPGYPCFMEQLEAAGYSAGSWGLTNWQAKTCPDSRCSRCGCGEEFRNCVDISIEASSGGGGGGNVPAPTTMPMTTTSSSMPMPPVTTAMPPSTTQAAECMAVSAYGKKYGATDDRCEKVCAQVPAGVWPCKSGGPCSSGCYQSAAPSPGTTMQPYMPPTTTRAPTPAPTRAPTRAPTQAPTQAPTAASGGCKAKPGSWASDRHCSRCTGRWRWWPCNMNPPACVGDGCKLTR